jgi:hypothetical protein
MLCDETALCSVALSEDSVLTAVTLAPGSFHAQQHTTLSAHTACAVSGSNAVHIANRNVAEHASSCPTIAALATTSNPLSSTTPSPACETRLSASVVSTLQHGSRVRIEGLQAAPQLNGRTGVVNGSCQPESNRWVVDVEADGAKLACRGSFCTANLRVIASHNFGSEWMDQDGNVWPKAVIFSRQCPKGHALVRQGHCGRCRAGGRLMCRICHVFCSSSETHEAASWLVCSVDLGCCGEYAVCCNCAGLPNGSAAQPAGSDSFCTLVSASLKCRVK